MAATFILAICLHVSLLPLSAQPVDSVLVEEYSIGSFQQATRIVLGAQGTIYILDADENTVSKFSHLQEDPITIGGFGWSSSSFDKPSGVATDGVNVYVSDYGNHRIQRFDRDLNYISSLSTRDTTDVLARFGYPLDVALSEFGDLFILDGENIRVMKFNPQDSFERAFGDIGAGKGKLQNPMRIVATNSRVYVGEKDKILVYDYFGNYLGTIGEEILSNCCGFTLLPNGVIAVSNSMVWRFSREGVLQVSIPMNRFICSEQIKHIQDVAFRNYQLFILSSKKIHVFQLKL